MSGPILEVRDLQVRMGAQHILRGVSLALGSGALVAVLGANGVGKTTLMRAISGVYRATGGDVLLEGRSILGLPSHRIVEAGVMQAPEGRQIFSNMTVRENLALGGGPLGMAELDHVLSIFPALADRLAQGAGSLSGGEQQMLCIGRALMRRPRVLLLDEPSLGLAPKLVAQIFGLMARIRAEGVSILLVEQNARAALRATDFAYVLEDGRVALSGPSAELRADPRVAETYLGGHVG